MGDVQSFLERWHGSAGSERANAQPFLTDLCDLLGVPRPLTGGGGFDDYRFEKPVEIHHKDGHVSTERIDLYKKGCFVLEAKQALAPGDPRPGPHRDNPRAWLDLMERAFGQALNYANYLPEGRPPFLLTCDVGHCFEVWSGFNGDFGRYGSRRTIPLSDLYRPEVREFLAAIFTDPWSLDPSRRAARATREVAARLAELAVSLEADGTAPQVVARFLMRCLFTMFAEDIGLLDDRLFTATLRDVWLPHPERFPAGIEALWKEMDRGGMYGPHFIRRFNGGLFREVHALPLNEAQLQRLLDAAVCDWSDVEPAIFGTLLERALNKDERHRLGAHFTPREYIERLVRPTVIEPLRAEWDAVQAATRQVMNPDEGEPGPAQRKATAKLLRDFLQRLCSVRVLDPACGTGNFLYVTFDLLKGLEAEVLRELHDLGDTQIAMELAGVRVVPEQFLGIEINPRAQAIADLVLWLGYLQWTRRAGMSIPDPVLKDGRNIDCRDAVLAYDEQRLRLDENGRPMSVWDRKTRKKHAVTDEDVPDASGQMPLYDYVHPRQAEWPEADFVVSNPPFIGKARRRTALGDGYLDALTRAWPDVPAGVDYVMYWWAKAASLLAQGKLRRFGFITTNSITQALNRRVVADVLRKNPGLGIQFAVPDHPWVDSESGAAVRIALTVVGPSGEHPPVLARVTAERSIGHDAVDVSLGITTGRVIGPDLSVARNLTEVRPLAANQGLATVGLVLFGKGFVIDDNQAAHFEPEVIHPYLNARDVLQGSRGVSVIDLYPMDEDEARTKAPRAFQHVFDRVRPERLQIRDPGSRRNWWRFGRDKPELRAALSGLSRYIVTAEVAKHRIFAFLGTEVRPDHTLIAIASDDPWIMGVMSSRFHTVWSLAAGGTLEDRPRYNRTLCFDPFPFPDATEAQRDRIRSLGETLDAHRRKVLGDRPDASLTGLYNSLERVREAEAGGPPLTDKERAFHDAALVGVLRSIHQSLDEAVADAYGWPADLPEADLLDRLVELNASRRREETEGTIRWLRPDLQKARAGLPVQPELDGFSGKDATAVPRPEPQAAAWPKDRYEQIKAIRDLIASRPGTYTAPEVATAFQTAPLAAVRRHLEMLERIGFLAGYGDGPGRRWQAGG
ncbi:MAG: hypothetical protein KA745_01850 [Gemmatimonadales bacterium]|nr:hypothetical protein [Gemmatimonadales bacterium]